LRGSERHYESFGLSGENIYAGSPYICDHGVFDRPYSYHGMENRTWTGILKRILLSFFRLRTVLITSLHFDVNGNVEILTHVGDFYLQTLVVSAPLVVILKDISPTDAIWDSHCVWTFPMSTMTLIMLPKF
jgi:hypothetical protein